MALTVIVPVAAAIIAALGGYLASSRRLSGRIATSEASSLWVESAAIRRDYREQINVDRDRIARLEDRIEAAEKVSTELAKENVRLSSALRAAVNTIGELRDELAARHDKLRDTIHKIVDE